MPIKTFRGLLTDGGQDTIHLHTNDGSTGYRIVKFQIMSNQPGAANQESVVQIFKVEQTSVPTSGATIDFEDQTLLAAGVLIVPTNLYTVSSEIVFDNEIFNQDIYVTHTDNESSTACNYYIELEQVKLDLNQNTVATLKDIRNTKAQTI
jgi:hypothetical protein